ncbi:helix-turn-helix domain-containing protein [Sphingomonas sp. 37zxx]|uniref:helix-turn-helix domain-containing protein n=1 Tax=Sphingomonas sp. 37zxx TaxID=1550073 RepID=UPI00053BF61E|nr:ImmA/IrrE family metallo-endopeptidase [Sphingomonas sp. 37zxx]
MSNIFNHALLLLARQYRGESQGAVAGRASLDQGHYSRIENGLLPEGPSAENVQKIADALDFPSAFFYLQDGLTGLPLSIHPMNRKKASVGVTPLKQIHAELNIRLIHLRRYLRAAEIHPDLPLPEIDVDEGAGPQEIARTLRRAWSVPEGPITNLTDLCERAGILVIWCDLGKGIDGVTLKVRDLPPCIFLNRNVPPDRMRASLAHELGHVIMHRIPTDEIEDEANAFAAELLVPERQFRRQFNARGGVTLEWLARQKAYWKVSMQFLLYRAGALGIVTRHQTEYVWKRISSLGWRTREPQETDFAYEEPTAFPELLKLHDHTLGYDLHTIGNLVSSNAADLQRLYRPYIGKGKAGLYAVK